MPKSLTSHILTYGSVDFSYNTVKCPFLVEAVLTFSISQIEIFFPMAKAALVEIYFIYLFENVISSSLIQNFKR
ncbi:hypothetical protein BpHYR1_003678 [Brachionus plicatilis]|uniref:Uncharacterized protein n=1 Tax=Brachionus plicatilis TaxID=10195 RepID=A0A3M7SB30_BRAPC|nr:hypothetical protein BpHYR1_003678 [Brachionus plicatilis]